MKRVRRRVAPWPVLAATAVALASCGVPPTGVIQAGGPATVRSPSITLYFLVNDRLVGVARQAPGTDVGTAVSALFDGPTPAEDANGLVTELPRLPSRPLVQATDAALTLRFPEGVAPLSDLALRQLVCTASSARRQEPADPRTAEPVPTSTAQFRLDVKVLIEGTSWQSVQTDAGCPSPEPVGSG